MARGVGAALGGDLSSQHHPYHHPPLHGRPPASERHTAKEERHHQAVLAQSTSRNPGLNLAPGSSNLSSAKAVETAPSQLQVSHPNIGTNQSPVSTSVASNTTSAPSLLSKQPEGMSSSSCESLTPGAAQAGVNQSGGRRGGGDHHPPSHIPRAVGASTSTSLHSLGSRGSLSQSASSSDQASPPPPTSSSASSSSSTFAGRLGQPPRGPLSLHSYSRKNVFLQHSLHTAELQALTQRDS